MLNKKTRITSKFSLIQITFKLKNYEKSIDCYVSHISFLLMWK